MAKTLPNPAPAQPAAANGPEYTVVARRYRPQQFAELVGQEPVARALTNALQSNRVAHAYLFTGARGVGKTSTARILAKALNCVHGPTPTPCDKCDVCQGIASGEDIDVLEIDGASNRGIDEVRAIRQNVQTRPSRSRYKIYIIDEVHMLTGPAFNALLKTLEEPPPHVKFIFATTEVQKIPVTILSRCQRFDFAGIGAARIVERLKQIVAAEGRQADDDALQLVARRAGGSMRDAQSLLDQLLAFGGERLTAQQVHGLLGTAGDERVATLVDAVLAHDAKKALELVAASADEGLQLGELLDQLIETWRSLMLVNCAGPDAPDVYATGAQREALARQASKLTLDTILAGLDVLTTAKTRLRGSGHAQVLLEMAVVRLCRLEELVSVAQIAQWLAQGGAPPAQANAAGGASRLGSTATPTSPAARTVEPPEAAKKKPIGLTDPVRNGSNGTNGHTSGPINGHAPTQSEPAHAPSPSPQSIEEIWAQTKQAVGHLMAVQLERGSIPAIFGPKTLAVRFPQRYSGAYDYCSEPANVQRIEAALQQVTGQPWSVRIELAIGTDLASEANPSSDAAGPSPRERERAILKLPLLQRAVDVLGATLRTMDPDFGTTNAPVQPAPPAATKDPEEP